jgi:hypothetical protein
MSTISVRAEGSKKTDNWNLVFNFSVETCNINSSPTFNERDI